VYSVIWVQMYTGLIWMLSSMEIYDGSRYLVSIVYRTYMGGIILGFICWIVFVECK
jgi:hypothetical protein